MWGAIIKKLIIINGVPGVGKTATCTELYQLLDNSVWLDGDWCWMMNPFTVTEENKRMVEDNIIHLLRNFIKNSSFQYIVFNWVIPRAFIFDVILDGLKGLEFEVHKFSLICSNESLDRRMKGSDREEDQIDTSIRDMKLYDEMNTVKIDTSNISALEAANRIKKYLEP